MRVVNVVLKIFLMIVRFRAVQALLVLDLSCWIAGTGLLMRCQVFLSIKGLRTVATLDHLLFVMCFKMAVESSLCREGKLTTLGGAGELLVLVCFLVTSQQLIVPKCFTTLFAGKGGHIHVFSSDVTFDGISPTFQRFPTKGALFIFNLHCFQDMLHLPLFIFPTCIHSKGFQDLDLHIMYLLA